MVVVQVVIVGALTLFCGFSLVTGSCYCVLENPSIGLQKYRATRETVTHLLAIALNHYDHQFSEFLLFCHLPEAVPSYFS